MKPEEEAVLRLRAGELGLSPRETEVALLAAAGHPVKQIALRLRMSLGTGKTHLRRIHRKLSVTCRAGLISKMWGPGGRILPLPRKGDRPPTDSSSTPPS